MDYYSLATLVVWQWIQVVMLASQDLLGPRWFVRESWVPSAYDYHPVLRYDEEGATVSVAPVVDEETRRLMRVKRNAMSGLSIALTLMSILVAFRSVVANANGTDTEMLTILRSRVVSR